MAQEHYRPLPAECILWMPNFEVDFSQASNRLIAAIHYLTINDQEKTMEPLRNGN